MSRFIDKTVLVTGGNSGMGEAAALAFAREGANVVIAARRVQEGERVVASIRAEGGEASFVATDVTRDEQVAAAVAHAVETYGALHVAFNNAGGGRSFGRVEEQTPESWRDEVALNLDSVFLSMRHELPALLAAGGGTIVNNASQLGLVGIGAGVSPYVAAKHGVIGLTRAAALEYAPQGVRINAIAPAGVDTPLFRGSMGATPEGAEQIRSLHPLGRIASPEEIATFVLYLASDDAAFFTGAALAMDGGWTAQ